MILLIYWLHNRVNSSNQSSIKEVLQSTRCSLICKTREKKHWTLFTIYMIFSFHNLFIWDQILIKTKKIISHFKIYWGQKFKNEPIWLVKTIYFNLHELVHTYALVADFFISFTTGKMVSRTSSRVFNNHRLINLHHFCCCPLKKNTQYNYIYFCTINNLNNMKNDNPWSYFINNKQIIILEPSTYIYRMYG